jgi:ubiquinone/menaquinone biosynthesis C-methylase UbiE
MTPQKVDYDEIAPTYDLRYKHGDLPGISHALLEMAGQNKAETILEVGCGTGRWLADLQQISRGAFGLDRSLGMLRAAGQRDSQLYLTNGQAESLPFDDACFDFIYCVHALHHFEEQRIFLREARRVLKPAGWLAVIGMDPHVGPERWYIYQYFDGTYTTDLARFPPWDTLLVWMAAAGFTSLNQQTVEHIYKQYRGAQVFEDPFLQKESTSQLVLLSDQAYTAGIDRLRQAVAKAAASQEEITFSVDHDIVLVLGQAG